MTTVDERRTTPRKRTLRSAKIVYGDYRYTLDCVIRDVGDGGARLRSAHAADAPNEFHLFDAGQLQKAAVQWRRGDEMGVRFVGDPVVIHESHDPRLQRFRFMT